MEEFIRWFIMLEESGWINACFILGAAAVILAIVGKLSKDIVLPPSRSIVLGLFGTMLISISVGSFLLAKGNALAPTPLPGEVTPAPYPQPTEGTATPMLPSTIQPIRAHFTVQVGTGLLANGTFSDGLAPYTEEWLWENEHFGIQVINPDVYPNGCDVSRYNTNLVWIGGSPGMKLTINDRVVGSYDIAPDAHGYVFHGDIQMGDALCAVNYAPSGFHIILGPDLYYHYDSYCYRGHC